MNLIHIAQGWAKALGVLEVSEEEKAVSVQRMKTCADCPKAKSTKVLEIVNGKGEYLNTIYCTECFCPVHQKSLVTNEKCPLGKWTK